VKALLNARGELYSLLGGQRDPEREREALAAEVARLRLTMRRSRGS
jgi:predicted aminopeptidase